MKKWIFSLLMVMWSFQTMAADYNTSSYSQSSGSWRRSAAIILFSGIGGAILGLSTLSFYGDPKSHTNNINMGAMLGALGGVGYLMYENQQQKLNQYQYNSYSELFPQQTIAKPVASHQPQFKFSWDF